MTRAEVEVLLKTVYKGEGATKALSDMDKISASGQKLTNVLNKANKALGGDILGGTGGSESFRRRNPGLFGAAQRQIGALMPGEAFLKQGAKNLMGLGPLFPSYKGPPPPVIPPGAGSASGAGSGGGNSIFQQFFSRFLSRAISIPAGLLVYRAINAPLQALTKTIKGLNDAIEQARKLYASALTSGLGLQFTTKRALLSQVIGVSEKDVLQFGAAIQFISPRLKSATDIISKTTPSLTSVSYGFKILEADMQALFAQLVSDFAPAIRKTTLALSEIIHIFEKFHTVISVSFKALIDSLINLLPNGIQQIVRTAKDAISALPDPGDAPNPVAYMQQIHASALEHMGLIVGGIGGQTDFAAQTAQNTKKTAEAVQKIAQKITVGSRGSFGDSLLYSMP